MRYQKFLKQNPEPGLAGGGPAPAPELQAAIDAAVGTATAGLRAKNSELLGKLKDAGTNLQRFDGIDPDAVRKILSKFAGDEEAALLAKGDIDAVLANRTKLMQADFGKQLQVRDTALQQAQAKATRLAAGKMAGELSSAATKAGALPEALDDIVYRAQAQGWSVNDDGNVVAVRDSAVVLGKDGVTPLTPSEWVDGLRDAAPHLWPKAQGSGAQGSGAQGIRPAQKGNMGGSKTERYAAIASKFPELNRS